MRVPPNLPSTILHPFSGKDFIDSTPKVKVLEKERRDMQFLCAHYTISRLLHVYAQKHMEDIGVFVKGG